MAVHPHDPASPLPDLLARLPEEIRRCVLDEAVRVQVPAGTVLFRPGDACSLDLLLTAGPSACSWRPPTDTSSSSTGSRRGRPAC